MSELTERQWPSKMLVRVEGWNPSHKGCCLGCNQSLQDKKWEGAFYGTFNDCCSLYDMELSFYTGYCKECAEKEAGRTRQARHKICPPVVKHTDNIVDGGFFCERKVYADGVVVENNADSIRDASRWW